MEIKHLDVVLCKFYFSDLNKSKDRPVLVFKDNLPHDDFIAIPISSKIDKMYEDEVLIQSSDFVNGTIPKISKLMISGRCQASCPNEVHLSTTHL